MIRVVMFLISSTDNITFHWMSQGLTQMKMSAKCLAKWHCYSKSHLKKSCPLSFKQIWLSLHESRLVNDIHSMYQGAKDSDYCYTFIEFTWFLLYLPLKKNNNHTCQYTNPSIHALRVQAGVKTEKLYQSDSLILITRWLKSFTLFTCKASRQTANSDWKILLGRSIVYDLPQ